MIGIGAAVAHRPLPHHRAYGSIHGGSRLSLKIAQRENLKYVQVQMGHSNIKVTLDVYGHLMREENQEAAVRTDEVIFGASV